MASDGQIVFEVTADGRHAIADIKEITRAIQNESRNWERAADESTENIGNSFSSMLKTIVAGFSAAKIGQTLLNIGKDALEAASALEEVQNVVDVTFGSDSGKIDSWAKNAGTQFGLTETQAKKFASTLGAMMKSSGMAGKEITDMSTNLAGLAADMASFYNLDFDTAFQKIRSGISGETEPLKQLGINMSVANLEAYALSKGLQKTFSDMSQGEQTMLRYQYLMEATADAQGDFARTSDGYANSLRQLETNIESIKTILGQTFIGVISEATSYLNGFLQSLMPDQKKKTVLDDFAEIDLKTEEKIQNIQETAEQARILTEELEKIAGSKINTAGNKVQEFATSLSKLNLDQGKVGVVKDFVSTLSNNIEVLAAIQGTDAEGAKAWLEGISEAANTLDPNDAEGWAKLINSIKEGLPGLENTDFGAKFFAALGEGFSSFSEQSSVMEWAVDMLGDKTNKTAEEQRLWLEICKQLVQTIPGLSSIINTETGEIKGGTQAVKDYIKAWEEGQTKLVLLGALEEKENALASRFSDLPGLQLDAALAERKVREQRKKIDAIIEKYGLDNVKVGYGTQRNVMTDAQREYYDANNELKVLLNLSDEATSAYNKQKAALEEAKQALVEYRQTIDEMPGSIENAENATNEWSEEAKANAQILIDAAQSSLKALTDYVEGVRSATAAAVNSAAKGLSKVNYSTYKQVSDNIDSIKKSLNGIEKGSDAWEKQHKELEKYNDQLITTGSIYKNLETQAQFLDDYISNLEKAQKMGLSDELLASLSDGSVESAQFLDALVNGQRGKTAKEVDKLFLENQQKIEKLSGKLTEQKLTVDQVYQQMAEDAKAAVQALDLSGEAGENSGKTVAAIAQGISDHVPDVKSAVDDIVAQLERINGYGVSIDFGSFGSLKISIPGFETGLNYVPFDGFLASLHEGEGILTAEENRVWRQFKEGGRQAIDYDQMGGVMRDNIHPGGNVYLDGRIVGSVISEQQGKSYRQLQRSGWQG